MLVYLRSALLDCLLCIVASIALSYTALSCFYATQPYQDAAGVVAVAGVCTLLNVAFFAASLNRTTLVVGSIVLVAVLVGAFALAVGTSSASAPMEDVAGNNLYLAFCVLLPPLCVFLLSRRRVTCVLLVVAGVMFCAVVEYLYWYGHVVAFALFVVSGVALYVYRTYQASLLDSESEHLAFGSVTAAGLALALVAVGVGAGLFAVVIAPLNPPNVVIKLITEHYRAEEKEVRGIGTVDDAMNQERSTEEGDESVESSDMAENDADVEQSDSAAGSNPLNLLGASDDNPLGAIGAGFGALTLNFPDWWPLLAAALVAALVAAVIGVRKALRKRRFNAMVRKQPDEAVRALYLYFLSAFNRFKIPQPGTLTLQEYAEGFSDTFGKFEQCLGVPAFAGLTQVYVRCTYGAGGVSESDLKQFTDYYRAFHKRACKYVGRLRYCRMFFRI